MARRIAQIALASTIACTFITDSVTVPDYEGKTNDHSDTLTVEGTSSAWVPTPDDGGSTSSDLKDRYLRLDAKTCATLTDIDTVEEILDAPGACPEGSDAVEIVSDCDGVRLNALWVQRVREDGTYGEPEKLSDDQCVTPADLAAAARREFRSMTIPTPEATLQGGSPRVVNVRYPAYTTAAPQDREVELLTVPVVIRAEPTRFAWDFDDPFSAGGGTLVTTDPGRPWRAGDPLPDASWVGHTYSRLGTPGVDAGTGEDGHGNAYRSGVRVSLTTTWQGRFRLQGESSWTDIPGTVTTVSTTPPATVAEARTRLVCDDLAGGSTC